MLQSKPLFLLAAGAALCSGFFYSRIQSSSSLPAGAFTIVVLPDTQIYSQSFPHVFDAQTQWIKDNRVTENIQYVLHLGDVTNHNTVAQWDNGKASMSTLDGFVPYAIAPGNHDYGPNGNGGTRDSLFNDPIYFGPGSPYATQSSVGGFFEAGRTENSWHTFSANGMDFLIVTLEWGPRDAAVTWADQIFSNHPDHIGILITHAYMYFDETRYDWRLRGTTQSWNPNNYGISGLPGGVNDGQALWEKLVSKQNVHIVLNGHVLGDGTGRLQSVADDDHVAHQMLVNFQFLPNGGNGYLRLLQFQPDGKTVRARSYSPWLNQYNTESDHEFEFGIVDGPVPQDHRKAVLDDNPALYYRLESASAATVNNLGALGTYAEGTYSGPGPNASSFDGTGQVETSGPLAEMSRWSIAAWARTTSSANQTIFSNDRNGFNDDVMFGVNNSRWAVFHEDDNTGVTTLAEASVLAELDWHHVVATSDGSTLRLYVDGDLAAETPRAGNDLDYAGVVSRVGRTFFGTERPFIGSIGEVAVFDRELCISEITEQYLAAYHRTTTAPITALGPTDPGGNPALATTVDAGSFPGIVVGPANEGDVGLLIGDKQGINIRDGILLATVTETVRDGLQASAEVGRNSFSNGLQTLSIMQAAFSPDVPGTNEVNFNTAVAWFPFSSGWTGAHVDGDGTLQEARGVTQSMLTTVTTGRHTLDLGVNSQTDGMLFTMGGENEDNIVPTGVLASGDGWDIRVQDNGYDFATLGEAGEDDNFSFLYLPYSTTGLIGGRYSGFSGTHYESVGSFTMTRIQGGRYRLDINGESPQTGMLLLTVSYVANKAGIFAPDDNVLSYQEDVGNFIIESRDLPNANLQDTEFVWAFLPWQNRKGPHYSMTNLVANQIAELKVTECDPGSQVIIAWSITGPGPTSTIYGDLDMSPPINLLPTLIADSSGTASITVPVAGNATGLTIYSQCIIPSGSGSEISNSLARVIE